MMTEIQQEFSEVFQEQIHRPGSENLLKWLGEKDFFHCAGQHQIPLRL